jgi:hypothetical protein
MKLITDEVWLFVLPSCVLFELHSFCVTLCLLALFNFFAFVRFTVFNGLHAIPIVGIIALTVWSSGECVFRDVTVLFGFRFDDNTSSEKILFASEVLRAPSVFTCL